jgi:adenylate cyclase
VTTRRLAAIVVVDVVGFSTMMARDEEGTLATLKAHRAATDPITLNHGGRIVKTTGDGTIVEVPSAVEAVRAAVELQRVMADRNAELPTERRMRFRAGIHLGDLVIEDDGDVYGDGVNVAARLEGLAEPGGVCLSEAVYRQVQNVLTDVTFEERGEQELRGIPTPVRTWAIAPRTPAETTGPLAAGVRRTFSPQTTVAVLPFDNLSSDPEQEHVADGITEDLITVLSHDHDLQVVARNSVFAFKGRPGDVRTIGRQLDARYVVEGSVRRAGDRIRVTAQLVEADSGRHLWAERYDRAFGDVFALQDEIVDNIRVRIAPTVRSSEEQRLAGVRPDHLDAWELLHRARWHGNRHTVDDLRVAIELAERALTLSPSAAAHMDLTRYWTDLWLQGWDADGRAPQGQQREHAEAAYEMAPDDAFVLAHVAHARSYTGATSEALALARRGVERNPHSALTWTFLAHCLFFDGQHDEAVEAATEAWRLGAYEAWRWNVATVLAYAHYLRRAYEPAIRWATEALSVTDYLQAQTILAAALAQAGRLGDARVHLARLTETRPGLTAGAFRRRLRWRRREDVDHFLRGVVAAGLPE